MHHCYGIGLQCSYATLPTLDPLQPPLSPLPVWGNPQRTWSLSESQLFRRDSPASKDHQGVCDSLNICVEYSTCRGYFLNKYKILQCCLPFQIQWLSKEIPPGELLRSPRQSWRMLFACEILRDCSLLCLMEGCTSCIIRLYQTIK